MRQTLSDCHLLLTILTIPIDGNVFQIELMRVWLQSANVAKPIWPKKIHFGYHMKCFDRCSIEESTAWRKKHIESLQPTGEIKFQLVYLVVLFEINPLLFMLFMKIWIFCGHQTIFFFSFWDFSETLWKFALIHFSENYYGHG